MHFSIRVQLFLFVNSLLISCSQRLTNLRPVAEREIDIMSFNIRNDNMDDKSNRWSNRKEACITMLNQKQPTIFGIQEGLAHQVDFLKQNLSTYSSYGVGRNDGNNKGEFVSIFYKKDRFNLIDSGTFWLSSTPHIPSVGWDAEIKRITSWVKLKDQKTGHIIFTFNTHFDHKGKQARKESAKLLVEKIKALTPDHASIFVLGDFNGLIRQSMFDPILSYLNNSKKDAPKSDRKKSYNGFGKYYGLINRNIDFIFYKNAHATHYETIKTKYNIPYISDHYPILARFKY